MTNLNSNSTSSIASLTVDATRPIALVNRNLYGHFAEHLGRCIYEGIWVGPDSPIPNTAGIRDDVVAALRAIHAPVIRWPGGCFADDYHWRDGIGPRADRPVRVNRWWKAPESNAFGTHEFLAFCRQVGAEPYICANVGSGTVREMSDWLEYLNWAGDSSLTRLRAAHGHPAPFKVRYWGIGNENWGCGGAMSPQYYGNEYRRYANYATWEPGDAPLFKIACGASAFDYGWTENFFAAVTGKTAQCASRLSHVDGYAFHYYCGTAGTATEYTEDQWYILLLRALAMEELVVDHRAIMDKYDPRRRIGLICDEWGTWHPPCEEENHPKWLYQQNTIRDALVAALTLNIFNAHADKVVMANIAQTVNVLQAMLLTRGPAIVRTPTYHVYEMYVPHHAAVSLPVAVDTDEVSTFQIPRVHASASVPELDNPSTLTVSVVNTHATAPVEVAVVVNGFSSCTPRAWRVLHGPEITAHNTFARPEVVVPETRDLPPGGIDLPPASVSVLQYAVRK